MELGRSTFLSLCLELSWVWFWVARVDFQGGYRPNRLNTHMLCGYLGQSLPREAGEAVSNVMVISQQEASTTCIRF